MEWKLARRYANLAALAVGVGIFVNFGLVLDAVFRLTPFWPPARIETPIALGLFFVLVLARGLVEGTWVDPGVRRTVERWLVGFEGISEWALSGRRPTVLAVVLIVLLFGAWAPHYLTWPYWTDQDAIATLAIGWEQGRLPWRDLISFQFPGEIEIFWVVGRIFGWGSSVAFYGVDLALLCILLVTVSLSSRVCLGRWLPGLVASFSILGYYAGLSFTQVAQRDWHAAVLAAMAFLLLITSGSWWARLLSSLAFAMGLTIRPHTVVFLPAIGLAFLLPPRGGARSWVAAMTWLGGVIAGLVITFSPVVLSGLTGDFLRAIQFAMRSGGPYAAGSLARSWQIVRFELRDYWTLGLAVMLLGMAWARWSQPLGRFAAVMLVALIGAFFYRPLHPVDHGYLSQPLELFKILAILVIVEGVNAFQLPASARLVSLLLLLDLAVPLRGSNCDFHESVRALNVLSGRSTVFESPLGASQGYVRGEVRIYPYGWRDYVETLEYLRSNTDSQTPVANLLTHYPYPSLNGAVGRVTPMPIEAISLMGWFPNVDFDAMIAPALDGISDAIVVCDSENAEGHLAERLRRTRAVLDQSYVTVARYGHIEIRRRSPRQREVQGSGG